jgi:hypothetical protein
MGETATSLCLEWAQNAPNFHRWFKSRIKRLLVGHRFIGSLEEAVGNQLSQSIFFQGL